MLNRRKAALAVSLVVLALGGATLAHAVGETTGTVVACATATAPGTTVPGTTLTGTTTPDHVIGDNASALETIPGVTIPDASIPTKTIPDAVASNCVTSTYTIPTSTETSTVAGPTTTVTSTVTSTVYASPTVVSLTLINADTDQPIGPLVDSATINLANARNLNVRADTSSQTASVRFDYDTTTNYRTESTVPFAFAGDSAGNYYPWTPTVGSHTIKVTPFDAAGATGNAGSVKTVNFTVTDVPNGTVAFRGDFESCVFTDPPWSVSDTFHGYTTDSTYARGSDYIVRDFVGSGSCALRMDLPAATTSSRADVVSQPDYSITLGQDIYYTDEIRLPTNWQIPTGWGYAFSQLVGQQPGIWGAQVSANVYGPGSGNGFNYGGLSLALQSGRCADPTGCATSNKYVLIPPQNLTTAVWHQYIIHVHVAQDNTGALEAWWRNRGDPTWNKTVNATGFPTLQWSGTTPNPALGTVRDFAEGYRGAANFPISIWHDNFCRATTFSAAESCLN